MGVIKIQEVSITSLKFSYEDDWLESWYWATRGKIALSPQCLFYRDIKHPLIAWMTYRGIPVKRKMKSLNRVFSSLQTQGQTLPIQIYKNMHINNGHKRASAMYVLGYDTIKAEIVTDDTKL